MALRSIPPSWSAKRAAQGEGKGTRAPSAPAPAPWASRDVCRAPAWLMHPAGALPRRLQPPADYQSGSIGNAPMKQCVTSRFANDSHSARSALAAAACLRGAA